MAKLTAAQRKTRNTKITATVACLAGAGVSIAANIIAAEPTVLGRAVAVWPALALLITVHLYQAIPVTKNGWLGAIHKMAVLGVIGVAGWVSYWHIVEVTLRAGESQLTAYLLPITIDAMMAIASAVALHKPKAPTARRRMADKATSSSKPSRSLRAV